MDKGILIEFLEKHFREVCDMLAWECTIEDELDIREEEGFEKGFLEGAKRMLNKGKSIQDVVDMLDLTASQVEELKKSLALA